MTSHVTPLAGKALDPSLLVDAFRGFSSLGTLS
jgi:hypothetical protein